MIRGETGARGLKTLKHAGSRFLVRGLLYVLPHIFCGIQSKSKPPRSIRKRLIAGFSGVDFGGLLKRNKGLKKRESQTWWIFSRG